MGMGRKRCFTASRCARSTTTAVLVEMVVKVMKRRCIAGRICFGSRCTCHTTTMTLIVVTSTTTAMGSHHANRLWRNNLLSTGTSTGVVDHRIVSEQTRCCSCDESVVLMLLMWKVKLMRMLLLFLLRWTRFEGVSISADCHSSSRVLPAARARPARASIERSRR